MLHICTQEAQELQEQRHLTREVLLLSLPVPQVCHHPRQKRLALSMLLAMQSRVVVPARSSQRM